MSEIIFDNPPKRFGTDVFVGTAYYNNKNNWTGGMLYISNWLVKVFDDYSERLTVLDGTYGIAENAFQNCVGITEISIPGSVKLIEKYAFSDCTSLSAVNMGYGIERIGDSAFYKCDNLRELIMPASITYIGWDIWALGYFNPSDPAMLKFTGPAPIFHDKAFVNVSPLTLYYPNNDETWSELVGSQFGASELKQIDLEGNEVEVNSMIKWIPYERDLCEVHTWSEGIIELPATSTEEGIMRYVCKVCGESRTESIPKKNVYSVEFCENNGSGTMNPVDVIEGKKLTLPENAFTAPSGRRFKAWQIGTVEYLPGDQYAVTADTTVIAVWEDIPPVTYAVTVNNGTGSNDYAEGASVTITADEPESGKKFKEWSGVSGLSFINGDQTSLNATFIMPPNDIIVEAVYEYSGVQASNLNLDSDANTLTGTVHCESSLEGTDGIFIVAFYNENGKMLNTWVKIASLSNDIQFTISGELSNAGQAKLFIMQYGSWIPLCAAWQKILCKRFSTISRMALWKQGGICRTSPWRPYSRVRDAVCAP